MGLVQVYQCDQCKKHITDPAKGLIIKGLIWQANPCFEDDIKNNVGSTIIKSASDESVFCLTCFENKVRQAAGTSCVRTEEKNFPRLVN